MLQRQPLRFLLADDPGAGKTIMTGPPHKGADDPGRPGALPRRRARNLVEQWQDELSTKFGLYFAILYPRADRDLRTGNPFENQPLLIARLDMLSRNEELQARLGGPRATTSSSWTRPTR